MRGKKRKWAFHQSSTQVLAFMLTNNMNLKVGLAQGKNMNTTIAMVNIGTTLKIIKLLNY
jgi:hypothetical protein